MNMILESYIEDLEKISADADSWGGKAAILGSLLKYSVPIPRGIVLHTHLYEEYERIRDNRIEVDRFKRELNDAISNSLVKYRLGEKVIFRSSANIEGSDQLCCSGIFESYSYEKGQEYADMVILVWESTHNVHTRRYLSNKIEIKKLKMGVLIQPVCNGEFSGIMQTCDVMRRSRDIVIEYCPWKLEAVVDGTENSEQVVLSEKGNQKEGLWRGSYSTLQKLYDLGQKVESILGDSVEIEFVVNGDLVNIIQARKIKGGIDADCKKEPNG